MNLLPLVSLFCLTEAYLSNGLLSITITRHHKGDVFTARGGRCYKDFCVSLSGGTAAPSGNGDCECKCGSSRPVFRDDLNTCVDDIQECNLLPFSTGSVTRKIPYVFLPLKGQIVYPSADIIISDVEAPVCVVSGGQFLGQSGWVNLRNTSGTETPFRLFNDEGRTYLQWIGETSMRMAMEGRIIIVHLMCKDASAIEEPRILTPCIGFRVAGNPSVKEMMFATDVELKEEHGEGGLSTREYVAIGACSVVLAVVYVAGVGLYLYFRGRRRKMGSKKSEKSGSLTLGEEGIIKSNPLLQAARLFSSPGQDNPGYVSDSNSCCSDTDHTSDLLCLDDDDLIAPQNMQTAALVHPCDLEYGEPVVSQDPNNMEKLPEENVSIVETLEVREHPETVKGMGCGNGRRKLYFNPSYFEPDLLKAPPPAAVEFLIKIREVIAIAKHKMSAKKFSPSLLGIPEEDYASKTDHNSSLGARKTAPSPENPQTPRPDFRPPAPFQPCCPSDAKQKIIRKWLEDVPFMIPHPEDPNPRGKTLPQETNLINKSKLWQMNEKETVPSPPARQDRKKTKPRAPPVPPVKDPKTESVAPPKPPPMPLIKHNADEIPRVQGKDCVPPAVAKNLMDAVIQELSTFRKKERSFKPRELPGKVNETWQETNECAEEKQSETEANNSVQKPQQDDHEYEIIVLNPEEPAGGGKDIKIYNLPEILSKSERSEGYSLVSEVYVNDGYSICSGESPASTSSADSDNVHYDVPNEKPGRLTIHVSDSPDRYKSPPESDNFEPDTLDRKPRRSRPPSRTPDGSERYSNQKFHDMECSLGSERFIDSLERPTNGAAHRTNIDDLLRNFSWNKMEGFGSLREIYEAKSRNPRRKQDTTSLIEAGHADHDRLSTLSWGEERRNKLLHRGIVLHINEQGTRRKKREFDCHFVPKKPSPAPRSRSASPVVSPRGLSPPLPPPRSTLAVSPPPRNSSSPSPIPADRRRMTTPPLMHPPEPTSPPPPPRPPKALNNVLVVPPRASKPPLPPKNPKRHPKPGKFAGRPLPPLPRAKDSPVCTETDALSTASLDSLNSSEYEAFYTLPYSEDEGRNLPGKCKRGVTMGRSPKSNPGRQNCRTGVKSGSKACRPEDSGYLSTDSESCCTQFPFPGNFSRIPESGSQNSETDESLCDGASESGGESIATDSFFYGNFNSKGRKTGGEDGGQQQKQQQQVHPCALRLSDVEVNSDSERRCVAIMVRP